MDIGDLRVMGKTADESCPLQAAAIVFSTWRKRHVRSVCTLWNNIPASGSDFQVEKGGFFSQHLAYRNY